MEDRRWRMEDRRSTMEDGGLAYSGIRWRSLAMLNPRCSMLDARCSMLDATGQPGRSVRVASRVVDQYAFRSLLAAFRFDSEGCASREGQAVARPALSARPG
jgi:hypothetical protein